MGNWQIGFPDDRYRYTIAASGEDVAYPATNAKRCERPILTWRSAAGGTQWLRADLGATAVPVAAIDVVHCNADSYTVETSNDAATWTTRRTTTPINANPWTARKNFRCVFSSPVTCKYVRVNFASAGAAYLAVGGLAIFAAVQTFEQNFGQLGIEVRQNATVTDYLAGGSEANSDGEDRVVYSIGKEHWRRSGNNALGLLRRLARVAPNETVHVHENNSDESELYCSRIVQRTAFTINAVTAGHAMTFEERV